MQIRLHLIYLVLGCGPGALSWCEPGSKSLSLSELDQTHIRLEVMNRIWIPDKRFKESACAFLKDGILEVLYKW